MPRAKSGFVPTTVKLSEVPGVPPPDPTVTSPSAANGNASANRSRNSPKARRFIGSPFSLGLRPYTQSQALLLQNTSRKKAAAGVTVEAVIFRQYPEDDLA